VTRRRMIATGVLAVWVGALGVLGWRELSPNEEKRRESLALLIEPTGYYYAVQHDGVHVGYASSQIDTSVFGIRMRNAIITLRPGDSDSNRTTTQYAASLTPRLRLSEFDVTAGRAPNRHVLTAKSIGDSSLELKGRRGEGSRADTVPFSREAITAEVVPFVLALGQSLKTGDVRRLQLFDRETNTLAVVPVKIEAESLFTLADSAAMDSTTGRFVAVHSDTVRAWKSNLPGAGGGVTWFDRNGRVVAQDLGGGLTLTRTAFELAFENWRISRNSTDLPADLTPGIPSPGVSPPQPAQRKGGAGGFY
jgi:hypothetical protein